VLSSPPGERRAGGALKGVILAGGEGTRLRPLTLSLPKPVVPIVDRPLLQHQIDLLATAGITEIVFSVAYRPDRVEATFGDGGGFGCRIVYAVEETPLGTGGAVRNALPHLDDLTVVFNGDVLTDVDLSAVLAEHRRSGARATLVLAPVENPSAFGLVETDPGGRVRRFVEKPSPEEITTNTVNAGIYVLDTSTLDLIPGGEVHSIERGFFPALLRRGDLVRAHVHTGYWIDVGTPAKYLQVNRDILARRFPAPVGGVAVAGGWAHPAARIDPAAELLPPFYVGPGSSVSAGARLGPDAVLVEDVRLAPRAAVHRAVLWAGARVGEDAMVEGALLGPRTDVGPNARVGTGSVLGEGSVISAFSTMGSAACP
jgi:NDP-sugar pyrophosphorylase family protein